MHGELNRAILNKLAPDFPVIVWHRSGHEFFLNDFALTLVGIDQAFVANHSKAAQEQIDFEKAHFYEQGALAIMGKLAHLHGFAGFIQKGLGVHRQVLPPQWNHCVLRARWIVSKPVQDPSTLCNSGDAYHSITTSWQTERRSLPSIQAMRVRWLQEASK